MSRFAHQRAPLWHVAVHQVLKWAADFPGLNSVGTQNDTVPERLWPLGVPYPVGNLDCFKARSRSSPAQPGTPQGRRRRPAARAWLVPARSDLDADGPCWRAAPLTPAAVGTHRCDVHRRATGRFSTSHVALTTTTGSWLWHQYHVSRGHPTGGAACALATPP